MCWQILCDKENTIPGIRLLFHFNEVTYLEVGSHAYTVYSHKNQW